MTHDLENMLRAEFRDERYGLNLTAGSLSGTVRRRHARRRIAGAATGVAVVLISAAVTIRVFPADRETAPPPVASSVAPARPVVGGEITLGDARVRGLPAGSRYADDPVSALAGVRELPAGVPYAVVTLPDGGPETLVVAAGQIAGLSGVAVEPAWLSRLGGAMALVTDDLPADVSYLCATTPQGRQWFLAVTGGSTEERLASLERIAVPTLSGG
jgi:hypothetical protein